ncbi:MAG: hypothetical protein KJ070_25150, partial [Verrucomicrobia bacterium]|nr:hypothetical protein [Verrucomicrobiota bacterium]
MKPSIRRWKLLQSLVRCAVRIFITAVFFLCALPALSRPRDPWPPLPEFSPVLYHESFDGIYSYGMTNAEWVIPNYGTIVESWSGYALERAGTVTPFIVPGLDSAGRTNVASEGALRFWLKPYWSSAPEGKGPVTDARLVELAVVDGKEAAPVWWLQLNPKGTQVSLVSQSDAGLVTLLKAGICWEAGQWHQLVLNYGLKGTALYLDGQLAGEGAGVWKVPPKLAALVWGSSLTGADSLGGELEELYTFSRPLEVAFHYHALKDQAALGPISPAEDQALAELRAKWQAEREARGETEGGGSQMLRLVGGTSECITNVPVYITNITAWLDTNAGWTAMFDIQGGTNGVLWDIFTTTNLVGSHITNSQWFWLERGPSCSTYQYTNQPEEYAFYILGNTNDADGGGLSDAFEQLVTHTDPNNAADDHIVPLVSVYVTDSVAVEQQSTNTARFLVTRLGGYMGLPLIVGCQLSGTASNGVDYYLSPVTTTATNVLVTFAPGQTSVEITLSAVNDSLAEGTEYATLTLTTNVSPCEVNSAHASATAWILEEYTKVYTTVADFNLGVMAGLEAVGSSPTHVDGRLQFKTNLPPQFPFINIACSDWDTIPGRSTVVRINTTNGVVIGEYRTAPAGLPQSANPSRTTVDLYGNVWVANRNDTLSINGTNHGSITRIGLIIGPRYSKTNGVYYSDDNGPYVSITNAAYNTCVDRDGDGYIRTSRGLADILPWNNGGGVDSAGGVSTAEDEAITEYVRVPTSGTRTIAVDKFNDIWVGGRNSLQTHLKVNGLLGLVVPNSVFHPSAGGYGGVIDRLGNLWSAAWPDQGATGDLLWLTPPAPTNHPPQGGRDWTNLTTLHTVNSGYGIAVDPLHPYIWQTTLGNSVFRWRTNGAPVTNASGEVVLHYHGFDHSQGLCVDTNGQVWVAHQKGYGKTIGHLDTNGVWLGNVELRIAGLPAEYFTNTTLSGPTALKRADGPIDLSWTNGWPPFPVPTNYFSVRWTGVIRGLANGEHVLLVSANAGAGFRLKLWGGTVIDNWDNPNPGAVELSTTNWLSTGDNDIVLEYKEFASGVPRITLSWIEPGATNKTAVPRSQLKGPDLGTAGPTGVSIDTAGNIWAANFDNNTAMRINPNAGEMVVTNGMTNFVGEVDLIVELGDGSGHQHPYDKPATPYNYSDMTGFNNRIVNPAMQPLKGYWIAMHDSGIEHQLWN